jgi:hypothetical protein
MFILIMGKKTVTVFFSDQNFILRLEGHNDSCLNIVRMEDASVSDLFKLAKEIFGNIRFPEGSVFQFGSASFLARVGTGT